MSDDLFALSDEDVGLLRRMFQDYVGGRLTASPTSQKIRKPPVETYYGVVASDIQPLACGTATVQAIVCGGSGSGSGGGGFSVAVLNPTFAVLKAGSRIGLIRDAYSGNYMAVVPPANPASNVVTNVCPLFGGSGNQFVTGITVEYTDQAGLKSCVTNPAACCGGSGGGNITSCCPNPIPYQLCVRFAGWLSPLGSALLTNSGGVWTSGNVTIPGGGTLCGTTSFSVTFKCVSENIFNSCGGIIGDCFALEVLFNTLGNGGTYLCGTAANSAIVCNPFVATFGALGQDTVSGGNECSDYVANGTAVVSHDITSCGGGGGGGINTSCCPSNGIPTTVYAHISGSGCCDGVWPVVWDGAGQWVHGAPSLVFECNSSDLFDVELPGTSANASSVSCSPFQVVFTGVDFTGSGGTTGATITFLTS